MIGLGRLLRPRFPAGDLVQCAKCISLGSALLFPAQPALAQAQADEQQPKNAAQITVYGWASGFEGRIQPGSNLPILEVDRSFGELLRDSNGAFWVTGLVRRDRFVVIADLSHTSSSMEGAVSTGIPILPVVEAKGGLKQTALTAAGGYRLSQNDRFALDLLIGARIWWVRPRLTVPALGVSRNPGVTFVDPLVAGRLNVALSPRWSVLMYGNVGGFGAGSRFTGEAAGTVNARVGRKVWISAGYRHLRIDYRKNGIRVDSTLSGPIVGATLTF